MGLKCLAFLIFMCSCSLIHAKCPTSVLTSMRYVIEHAVWRGWHQALIYTTDLESECRWAILRLVKCLGINGIASAVDIKEKARLYTFLGIVIFQPTLRSNTTNKFNLTVGQITKNDMNTVSYDWLIMARSVTGLKIISETLSDIEVRFDQNILVALPDSQWRSSRNLGLCDSNFMYKPTANTNYYPLQKKNDTFPTSKYPHKSYDWNKTQNEISHYWTSSRLVNITRNRTYKSFDSITPLWRSSSLKYNSSRIYEVITFTKFSLRRTLRELGSKLNIDETSVNIYVIQLFKTRVNSTLLVGFLGAWNPDRSMSVVDAPYPVEARNLMGDVFTVGRCNCSSEGTTGLDEYEPMAPALLEDILDFLTRRLNATSVTRYYEKLGFRTYEGAWTGLLGALMDNSVDIALEPVTAIPARQTDMNFIFPIAETMYNIYIRHQETSAVRDIFLAPFSPQLIACVACVALMAAIVMLAISRIAFKINSRRMSCADAIIWSTGLICQQGSSWSPSNPAASVLIIVCLLFALVIYNAYAAFITSVLSVRVANVASLADVLQSSHIKIGYVRNGADQTYLMSTKDVQLNAFYIRGYSEAENLVSSPEEGLVKAAKEDYAFFSGQRSARTTIRSLSQARGRCALRELPVLSTRAHLVFPIPNDSPYARPLLMRYDYGLVDHARTYNSRIKSLIAIFSSVTIGLLQLRSGGILGRLEAALVSSMPQCTPPSGFASARAADVKTALFVILTGLVSALFLGICEYSWKRRRVFMRKLKRRYRQILD